MAKEESLEANGVVLEALRGRFRVELDIAAENASAAKPICLATLAGKLAMNRIKVVPGDKVKVALSPYDLTRGRIVYRNRE